MPELPEVQAHAERLADRFDGRVLTRFVPIKFTALRTALPAPDEAYGQPLRGVGRRGKYLLLEFESVHFAVHLMQGGRLLVDEKQSAKPRGGQARFVFDEGPALLLTEAGTERRAGVWCLTPSDAMTSPPLDVLGPDADTVTAEQMVELLGAKNQRLHGFLRDQRSIAGLGRRLANEICHHAKLSPFAMTGKLGAEGADLVVAAIAATVAEGLEYERSRPDMSSSKDRPSSVHKRTGEPCPVCGDAVRAVEYSGYTVHYCPTCQTGGKVLADNTTSKFLK
ncbi:MAG: DNA-formamidopyrimidine glycosylase family protein [Ilumatobacter sp.]|uniref:DNA-formamidopyrimidine glycosylase family protein n=1 Tax=Ilumatobacter sp. TaxID=1967498 RepID=UPI0026321983|nr:DNA-formamidopyrimidine glycosylase family protein [Ilumatobacter sp.]MDJ0769748.1 DNA-formamidopyrimidine glycosylase family protein [Ilumatobacter sp.]